MPLKIWRILKAGMREYGRGALFITVISAGIFLIWACYFTPLPVYALEKLNLRTHFLPNMTCAGCNNFSYPYLIDNSNFCGDEEVFLLIMVASYHPNVIARKVIRQTWGSVTHYRGQTIKTLFIFGIHADKNLNHQVKYELDNYGDVIHAEFKENYRALSNKTMVGLQWVHKYCPQAKFVLKTDDDAFNIPQRYVDFLFNIQLQRFIGGYCFTIMPDRSPVSKFYTPPDMYPYTYYPTYCSGPGYIVSQAAVVDLVRVAPHVRFLPMEDVFVGGLCRVTAGIPYIQIEGTVISKHAMTRCNTATWAKNSHNTVPEEAEQIWKDNVLPADTMKDCLLEHVKMTIGLVSLFVLVCVILYRYLIKR